MSTLAMIATAALAFTGCKDSDPVKVTAVALDATEKTLEIQETFTLKATVTPADATDTSITWSSTDDKVATVNGGIVIAQSGGKATITATANDGSGAKADCEVTVKPTPEVNIAGSGIDQTLEIKTSEVLGGTAAPVVIDVTASRGVANFWIAITSSSTAFTYALSSFGLNSEFDLANPDAEMAGKLAGLGELGVSLPFGDQVSGNEHIEFNVTQFLPLIVGLRAQALETGDCTADFKITVIDSTGLSKNATVKLELVYDLPAE
jgi:hypothetical protein